MAKNPDKLARRERRIIDRETERQARSPRGTQTDRQTERGREREKESRQRKKTINKERRQSDNSVLYYTVLYNL